MALEAYPNLQNYNHMELVMRHNLEGFFQDNSASLQSRKVKHKNVTKKIKY